MHKIKTFFNLLIHGKFGYILKLLIQRTYSNTYSYFFKKDISIYKTITPPTTSVKFKLRTYKPSDSAYFKNLPWDDLLLNANIDTCYVAETLEGIPCYRQWFIEPSQNPKIKSFFGDNLPQLAPDECMFERVFVTKEYRGLNLAYTASYPLVLKALELGYKSAVGCIDVKNTRSLRAAVKTKAVPKKIQIAKWRFFKRRITYQDIPEKFKSRHPWLFATENNTKP